MPADVEKRRFTVDEYQRMGVAGILTGRDRVELIEGDVVAMTPIGPAHAAAVDRVAHALMRNAGPRAVVRVQGPIRLDGFTEPQPDVALLRAREDGYRTRHPEPADVLLVVEIAETSLRYDREVKASLYARHAIVEYWLLDLAGDTLSRHTQPEDGTYRDIRVLERGATVSVQFMAGCTMPVGELL